MKNTKLLIFLFFSSFLIITFFQSDSVSAAPDISLSTKSVVFADTTINTMSWPFTVLVNNNGTSNLTIGPLSISGIDVSEFRIEYDTCSGKVLAPSEICYFYITFLPLTEGEKHATINVPSDDPDTPAANLPISGTGVIIPMAFPDKLNWKTYRISLHSQQHSIAIDSQGHPHIIFADDSKANSDSKGAHYTLKHAYFNGKTWRIETIDKGDSIGWSSIAIDSKDCIHVSYQLGYPFTLKYAYFDGSAWNTTAIESGGGSASITVDEDDLPHISHAKGHAGALGYDLRYARFNGSEWIIETVVNDVLSWGPL